MLRDDIESKGLVSNAVLGPARSPSWRVPMEKLHHASHLAQTIGMLTRADRGNEDAQEPR